MTDLLKIGAAFGLGFVAIPLERIGVRGKG
mgnify:CR=1 FL=1